jgi:murein DD-endopeptidase MepM/ murein hydrolase activator NlpD
MRNLTYYCFILAFLSLTRSGYTQSLHTFRAMEACTEWNCVVALVSQDTQSRLDLSIPWRLPLKDDAWLSSQFGLRIHPILGDYRFHGGVDLAAPTGTPVYASGSGWAIAASDDVLGQYIIIDHLNGFKSYYGHLSASCLDRGQRRFIRQGEAIGLVGQTGRATGPHLHWTVRFQGNLVDPLLLRQRTLTIL